MDFCTGSLHLLFPQYQLASSLQLDLSSSIVISRQPFTDHPIYKGHVPLQLPPLFCSAFLPLEWTCLSVSVCSAPPLPRRQHLGQGQVT